LWRNPIVVGPVDFPQSGRKRRWRDGAASWNPAEIKGNEPRKRIAMSDDFAALRIGFSRLSLCGVGAFVTANNQIAESKQA
jgi:hypothetical protein